MNERIYIILTLLRKWPLTKVVVFVVQQKFTPRALNLLNIGLFFFFFVIMAEIKRRRIARLLDNISDEELLGGSSSTDDCSPDENVNLESSNIEQSGESTDNEIHNYIQQTLSADCDSYHESDDEIPLSKRVQCFYGKDGTKWNCRKPNQRTKNPSYNKITEKPGVTNLAKDAKTEIDAWYIFFTGLMIEQIVSCTNIYSDKIKTNFPKEQDIAHTTAREMVYLVACTWLVSNK